MSKHTMCLQISTLIRSMISEEEISSERLKALLDNHELKENVVRNTIALLTGALVVDMDRGMVVIGGRCLGCGDPNQL